jgi:hypothetical protein
VGGGRSDYEKFLLAKHISHKIDRISHKIDRICPIYFYNNPILPDCEANIARLALFAQQTGGGGLPPPPPPPPGTPMRKIEELGNFTNNFHEIFVLSTRNNVLFFIFANAKYITPKDGTANV